MPPVSNEVKRIYASAPMDAYAVQTLELSHTNFSGTWYLNDDRKNWSFNIDSLGSPVTFLTCPFKIKLPTNNTEGGQELQIAFANIGEPFISEIEAAIVDPTEAISATYRIYLNVEYSVQQNNPDLVMAISSVVIENSYITAQASRFDILNNRFPTQIYTTQDFPGLLR